MFNRAFQPTPLLIALLLSVPCHGAKVTLFGNGASNRPGHKKSRMWGGPVSQAYLCDETAWTTSRHADAWSTTVAGNLVVALRLSITYYDEYKIWLLVMDKALRDESDAEFVEEYRRRHPGGDPSRQIKLEREAELKF